MTGNGRACYLNGEVTTLERAAVSPLDRGFLLGDGVYEVIPCYGGTPFRLDAHLRRLQDSLAACRIRDPLTPERWRAILGEVCEANGGGDLALYLQVTRGCAQTRAHEFPDGVEPTVFVMASPLPSRHAEPEGLRAVVREDPRWARCDIKAIALLPNVLLRQEAVDTGADEAILQRDGVLTEGAASTVFIARDGVVATPRLHRGLLPGITREVIRELAERHGLPCETRTITVDELRSADEVWLSSATKEVAPVIAIDGQAVGDGNPGPLYRRMRAWFSELREDVAHGRRG